MREFTDLFRRAENNFRAERLDYVNRNPGASWEDADKQVLHARAQAALTGFNKTHIARDDSAEIRALEAALHLVIGAEDLAKYRKGIPAPGDPAWPPGIVPATDAEKNRLRSYVNGFVTDMRKRLVNAQIDSSKSPPMRRLRDGPPKEIVETRATHNKLFGEMLERLATDARFVAPGSLKALIAADPYMQDTIGLLLDTRYSTRNFLRHWRDRVAFVESCLRLRSQHRTVQKWLPKSENLRKADNFYDEVGRRISKGVAAAGAYSLIVPRLVITLARATKLLRPK